MSSLSAPTVLWCFWTGTNAMSPRRRLGYEILRSSGLIRQLITPSNLQHFIRPGFPLHEAYEYLSYTHRSDYLRSYFMLHYGGAYSDIKPFFGSLRGYVKTLNRSKWDFVGSAERHAGGLAVSEPQMAHVRYASNTRFIFKPGTEFASRWNEEVNSILDHYVDALPSSPGTYHPRATVNGVHDPRSVRERSIGPSGYPLRWAQLQGEVFHRLQESCPSRYGLIIPFQRSVFYR